MLGTAVRRAAVPFFVPALRRAQSSSRLVTVTTGLTPPKPQQPFFDRASGAWIVTRYAEALAAFRHPLLWPVDPSGKHDDEPRDTGGALVQRRDVLEMLSPSKVAEWQPHLVPRG